MSKVHRIIAAEADPAENAHLAAAYSELESAICDLNNMGYLVKDAIETALGGNHKELTGRDDWIHMPCDQCEAVIFAVYHLEHMIRDLKDNYFAAFRSKEVCDGT